jgi:hypothetical protein
VRFASPRNCGADVSEGGRETRRGGDHNRDRVGPRGDRRRAGPYRAGEDAGTSQGIEQGQTAQETN